MVQVVAGGIVYEVSVRDLTEFGASSVKKKIQDIRTEADQTDISLKSLAKDTTILGSALTALGGTAVIAGTAIGGEFGEGLQYAGAGLSIVGLALATVVPALRGLAVAIDGTLIPALIRLNAFLGPYGWLVIGLGAAAAAIGTYVWWNDQQNKSLDETADSADEARKKIDGFNDALKEKQRIQKELAGIPQERGELEFELRGARIDEATAAERVKKAVEEGISGIALDQIIYSYESAMRRRTGIETALTNLDVTETEGMAKEKKLLKDIINLNPNYPYPFSLQNIMMSGDLFNRTPQGMPGSGFGNKLTIHIHGTVSNETFTVDVPISTQMAMTPSLKDEFARKGMVDW